MTTVSKLYLSGCTSGSTPQLIICRVYLKEPLLQVSNLPFPCTASSKDLLFLKPIFLCVNILGIYFPHLYGFTLHYSLLCYVYELFYLCLKLEYKLYTAGTIGLVFKGPGFLLCYFSWSEGP